MKNYRERLLDKVVKEEGLETHTTLVMFAMSELYPSEHYDGMMTDLYEVLRAVDVETEEENTTPTDNMNMDADAYEDIIANLYEWAGFDE